MNRWYLFERQLNLDFSHSKFQYIILTKKIIPLFPNKINQHFLNFTKNKINVRISQIKFKIDPFTYDSFLVFNKDFKKTIEFLETTFEMKKTEM